MSQQNNEEHGKEEAEVTRWMDCVREGKPLPTGSTDRRVNSPDWWKPENIDPEVESAISGFMASKTALASLGDDEYADASDVGVYLQLVLILEIIPEHYVVMAELDNHKLDASIWVSIEDLYEQLTRGAVKVSVSTAVFGIPVGLVTSSALRDERTVVELPLKAVVGGLDAAALSSRVPRETQHYDTDSLPAIFAEGGEKMPLATDDPNDVESAETIDTSPPPGETATPPVEQQETDLVPEPIEVSAGERGLEAPGTEATMSDALVRPPMEPRVEAPEDFEAGDSRLSGVDLNLAMAEQLTSLEGISAGIARNIVAYRNETGPFGNVFDLARVPGVGRKRFKRITGMAFSRTGTHRTEKLARLLGIPVELTSHLPSIAKAVAGRPGLQGCVISDKDGLLLAEDGIGDDSRIISAIVPRMLGQIRENMGELDEKHVDTASVSMRGRLLTVIDGGHVYLSIMHESNRLTSGMLKLVQRLARELEWLLSYRGYVSHPSPEAGGTAADA